MIWCLILTGTPKQCYSSLPVVEEAWTVQRIYDNKIIPHILNERHTQRRHRYGTIRLPPLKKARRYKERWIFCWCFNMWLRLSTACVFVYVTWWVSLLRQHLLPGLIVQQMRPQSRLPLKHHDQHERAEDRNDTHNSSYCTDGWGITLYTDTEGGTSTSNIYSVLKKPNICAALYISLLQCVCWPVWPAARGSRFSLAGHTDWRSECSPLIQWCWPRHDPAPPPRGPSSPPAYAWSTHPHTIRGITVIYYEHVTLRYLKSKAYDTSM